MIYRKDISRKDKYTRKGWLTTNLVPSDQVAKCHYDQGPRELLLGDQKQSEIEYQAGY